MPRVAIVDSGLCNLRSVVRAVEECGGEPRVAVDGRGLAAATHIVLPGVGTFAAGMARLRAGGFVAALGEEVLGRGLPFLGICLGMQLLATRGFEGGETEGLGWIPGEVRPLEPRAGLRLPHAGWNDVAPVRASPLFAEIAPGTDFYFVHGWQLLPERPEDVLARAVHGASFVAAVARGPVHGVQFHPEKSQRPGLRLLRNFLGARGC